MNTTPADNPVPWTDRFVHRHIGPNADETAAMLETCGHASLDAMIAQAVPQGIRLRGSLRLPAARSEFGALTELRAIADRNKVFRSFIGMGYHDCITPGVVRRNILENPGWYTQYTPYQAEISQGRLEALLNFQTMIVDLTAMEIANASLLDEGTAAAEAMAMAHGLKGSETKNTLFLSESCHPQTIEVVCTRAAAVGVQVVVGNHHSFAFTGGNAGTIFAVLLQYPATDGTLHDYRSFVERAHASDALVIVAADLLALTLLTPPGEWGADVVVGNTQRFGVPLGYGGPHAAFFATRDAFKRSLPGRLVGVSKDATGRPALRLALQTREQHIRREKATSNICTAQVLLAVVASMYAVYHGPEGLKQIARRIHRLTTLAAAALTKLGFEVVPEIFFDTLKVNLGSRHAKDIVRIAEEQRVNVRVFDAQNVGVSFDETTSAEDLEILLNVFNGGKALPFSMADLAHADGAGATPLGPSSFGRPGPIGSARGASGSPISEQVCAPFPAPHARTSLFLTHPVFHRYRSETEMLRYIRRLESRDLSLTGSMIPLGSCTMKLNASAEMFPVTWPEFGRLHPFAPTWQAEGYKKLFHDLEAWFAEITGLAAVSLQPNAGSAGEFAGLLVIRAYHESRGNRQRNVCLIPASAHGTNPASAVLAGMKVLPIACDRNGNIDLTDLRAKAAGTADCLSALMITYPSTHGVFEESIREICQIIHAHGGQVYMDGANMNAQVGLTSPGHIGADVCHLNLHKTFCVPHGGGGPGVGPICVAPHLAPFLPRHPFVTTGGEKGIGPISAAPWGSASILVISWLYLRMMGPDGLTDASKVAILNANYVARRLEKYFPTLYKGPTGLVAHECILDLRGFKATTAEDVAKRLIDYSFHAPTLSWPVAGTLMVEPTESESKVELDRFCEAMIAIHGEMTTVESGAADRTDNVLKNAPHTAAIVCAQKWDRPYSREQAAFPVRGLRDWKFWPPVGRVDNVYGDRHPVCSCAGMEDWAESK